MAQQIRKKHAAKARARKRTIDNPLFERTAPDPVLEEEDEELLDEGQEVEEIEREPVAAEAKPEPVAAKAKPKPIAAKAKPKPASAVRKAAAPPKKAARAIEEPPEESLESVLKKNRALNRENKELLIRVREMELERAKSEQLDAESLEQFEDVSEESQGILSIVQDFEAQMDGAFALKEALESDLADAQARLDDEARARSELEARIPLLEAKEVLLEQLQDELSFVEEERAEMAKKYNEADAELFQARDESKKLAAQLTDARLQTEDLERTNVDLAAQALNLEEKVVDLAKVRRELSQAASTRDDLSQQANDLSAKLEASETSRKAIELDLSTSRDVVTELRNELGEQEEKLAGAEGRIAELGDQIDEQRYEIKNLQDAKKTSERELKKTTSRNEKLAAELDSSKKALRAIHGAASRTTKRIQGRYKKS